MAPLLFFDTKDEFVHVVPCIGQMIDEFEDVSIEEKELMKLWNAHVAEYVHYSDANVPFLCEEFARKWGAHLIARGLRHNFLMHLLTLWDFAVIDYASVDHCIGVVDAFKGTVEAFEVGADEYAHAREENGEGGKEGDTTSSASNGWGTGKTIGGRSAYKTQARREREARALSSRGNRFHRAIPELDTPEGTEEGKGNASEAAHGGGSSKPSGGGKK